MAIQAEGVAANALLYNISDDVKCHLHYDTTSRCKIDVEWPAIILNLSDKERYSLRPRFFAYEDRKQIVRLLVETIQRLALLVTPKDPRVPVTTKELRANVKIIMTDSVEKNLHIEEEIACQLNSDHVPLHTLCKAHTVEALDRSNIEVLGQLDKKVGFHEALESTNPAIKSFLRGEKDVAVSAIKSILKFVSHNKSTTSSNQAGKTSFSLSRETIYQAWVFVLVNFRCNTVYSNGC